MGRLKEYSIVTTVTLLFIITYPYLFIIWFLISPFILIFSSIYFLKRSKLESFLIPSLIYSLGTLMIYILAKMEIFGYESLLSGYDYSWLPLAILLFFLPGSLISFLATPFIVSYFEKKGKAGIGVTLSIIIFILLALAGAASYFYIGTLLN